MTNILIASLGNSPVVVTAMVKQLAQQANLHIDEVHLLYTDDTLAGLGADFIEAALDCPVRKCPLTFADVNSFANAMQFLNQANESLQGCRQDNVYLSVAGGRKSMSVMLAMMAQFYPNVRKLYHLISQNNVDFYTIEQLYEMLEERRKQKLMPDTASIQLIEIPFQCYSQANEIYQYLQATEDDALSPLETSGAACDFFKSAIQGEYDKSRKVFLSQAAWDQFHNMDSKLQELFINCFNAMRDPQQLKNFTHKKYKGLKTDCKSIKRGRTQERPFYYIQDNKVVVAQLTLHKVALKHTPAYEQFIANGRLCRKDHPAYKSVSALHPKEGVLIVPLGRSPMVATQMYTLFRQAGWEISRLIVIYPEKDPIICKGVNILRQLCKIRSIGFEARPIQNLADVDTNQNCITYRDTLIQTIKSVRHYHPKQQVLLSLAAGRKSMSVLTLFAAQYAHVSELFHTLISDPDYEQQIEQETTLSAISHLQPKEIENRYFLDAYDLAKFDLFTIPVIPVK